MFGMQNYIWVIYGTHVAVDGVPKEFQHYFCSRKGLLTQNVLVVCDFDMLVTFVTVDGKGLHMIIVYCKMCLADRILHFLFQAQVIQLYRLGGFLPLKSMTSKTLVTLDKLVFLGQFYVVDLSYSCQEGFLPPYKGEQYHLCDL